MIKKIISLFDVTFLKFIVVGIINTIFGTSIMFIFYNVFHLSYWVSSFSNYFFGSILSYILNNKFTFKNDKLSKTKIPLFIVNISVCYFLAYGLAKSFISYILSGFSITIQENVAMLGGMCLFVLLNYIGQRFIVFKKNGSN